MSTGGASPALAGWLRLRVAAAAGPGLGALAELLDEARRRLPAEGRSTEDVDWPALLDGPLPELVRRGDLDAARALLARRPPGRTAEPAAEAGPASAGHGQPGWANITTTATTSRTATPAAWRRRARAAVP